MGRGPFFLVSGRWDNTVALVELERALERANDATPNAIIARVRVTPDIDIGRGVAVTPASGQPVSVAVAADGRTAYVVNHSGLATETAARAFQHGHPGTVTVLDPARALDPADAGTTNAIVDIIPTGTAGPVGIALTADQKFLAVSSAEAAGREDGGCEVTLIDVASRAVARRVALAHDLNVEPCPDPAPHQNFGRFPNPNGVAVSPYGGGMLFTANGGTDDVSVVDLGRALGGHPGAEVNRIAVEAGPFGIAAIADGRLVAVANRESARTGREGGTVALLDVARAASGASGAEVARVRVGNDDPATGTRPFAVAFTPDGRSLVATCFRANTISLIDVDEALRGRPAEVARLTPRDPAGGLARPRGIAMTPDGRYAAVTGGAKGAAGSSVLWILDLARFAVAATVAGVGNESYLLDVVPGLLSLPASGER
jgi:DNA-binding beta-propeller fold protein YncE